MVEPVDGWSDQEYDNEGWGDDDDDDDNQMNVDSEAPKLKNQQSGWSNCTGDDDDDEWEATENDFGN